MSDDAKTQQDPVERWLQTPDTANQDLLIEHIHQQANPDDIDLSDALAARQQKALSQPEQDEMFDAIWANVAPTTPSPKRPTLWSKKMYKYGALAAALCAIFSVAGLVWQRTTPRPKTYRIKNTAITRPQVTLTAFEGQIVEGHPKVTRDLVQGETLQKQTHVVFRYAISEASWLLLFGQQGQGQPELLWQSGAQMPGGQGEIKEGQHILSLPSTHYKGPFTLGLIAIRNPPLDRLKTLPKLNESDIEHICHDCAISLYPLVAP